MEGCGRGHEPRATLTPSILSIYLPIYLSIYITDPQDSFGAPEVFRESGAEAMSPARRAYMARWVKMIDAEAALMVEEQAPAVLQHADVT